MSRTWKIFALVLVAVMLMGMFAACTTTTPATEEDPNKPVTEPSEEKEQQPEEPTEPVEPGGELPRNETLYFAGLQWGAVNGWNPLSGDMNNAMAVDQNGSGARTPMFESLYMYNLLDGKFYPLLADGDFVWNENRTQMTIKLNKDAKWSDGTPVVAEDVAYTYTVHAKYDTNTGVGFKDYIEKIEATDDSTVVIHAALSEDGMAKNPLMLLVYIEQVYVLQKGWLEKVEARNNNEATDIKNDPGEDAVHTGPYKPFYHDDQKVVLIRDDNYWGQADSMWGKLPVPKYLAHTIYADNAAGQVALAAGEVDVCQQFIENIQNMWLEDNLPISTYMDEAPYGICVSIPTAYYNINNSYGLDNVAVRKAIAMAVDYETIIANAMTNQSPTFEQVPRSLMNPTEGEQALYDHNAVKELQWAGNDIKGAKALLDAAGIVDTDGDGYRELDGEKLSYNACCPNGWTDWQAAIEIVAAAGEKIGIEITTLFPEWSVYQTVVTAASQTEYDIFMMWTDGASPVQPWGRIRQLLSSEFVGIDGNWSGNWGGYTNDRIDAIIKEIPTVTDEGKLKDLYTEAVQIYLTEVPSFALMYRPGFFHAVNESVWTNYPEQGDGLNIPPTIMINGYGIAGLYNLELVE